MIIQKILENLNIIVEAVKLIVDVAEYIPSI